MPHSSRSLRRTLVLALVVVAALTVVASACLVFLTRVLHDTSGSLAETLGGVRVAEKMESDLLLADRSDGLPAVSLAAGLRRSMQEMGQYISTDEEAQVLQRVRGDLERYLQMREGDSATAADRVRLMRVAYADLARLIEINLQQARDAEAKAALWDKRAGRIGGAASVLAFLLTAALARHLRSQAFRPLVVLAGAIDRYARGDSTVRAAETGPAELREIAVRFNAMADALARQHVERLAFLSGVAHDLRTPLSILRMDLDTIDRQPDGPRRADTLQRVRRQIGRLERMTTDFIDAAQIESGRMTLDEKLIDACDVVLRSAECFADDPSHPVEVRHPERPLSLWGDLHRLEQVLVNLISNAVKYSPQGSPVRVDVRSNGGRVVFSVEDEGVGMTKEEAAAAFEPFRRAGRLQAEIPGAGLGLSIVRRIVDAHGGEVRVATAPGRGSTFEVWLPASASRARESEVALDQQAAPPRVRSPASDTL